MTAAQRVLHTYVTLTLLSTFSSSFIWGINTLFLLDAGLSVTQAFLANAFFTLGQMLFEVPTGVVADTMGRRVSYLLGAVTLLLSTLAYLAAWHLRAPFWAWALSSVMLGLGFTFFSGATEAWLVDALKETGYERPLETAFARGQMAQGAAMLTGTLAGGLVAQATNLGVPYLMRAGSLGLTFVVAFVLMKDIGFTPRRDATIAGSVKSIIQGSLRHGLRQPPVRWVMLSGPFVMGAVGYGFYAMQPYLLQLYGKDSYAVAGLAATIVAAAQIAGGVLAPRLARALGRRTSLLFAGNFVSVVMLGVFGVTSSFVVAVAALVVWGLGFAATMPIKQAYLNGLIPSAERATVLSSDNLISSAGGVVFQPALAKVADVAGYPASYLVTAGVQLLALPFILLARRENASSDPVSSR